MGLPLFIHINHPCEEVDLWRVQQPELEKVARGQGYIYIEELRNIVSSHADLLEALEELVTIVETAREEGYDNIDYSTTKPARLAIEKAK